MSDEKESPAVSVLVRMGEDITAALREIQAGRLIRRAIGTLAKEQPEKYGQLVGDIEKLLRSP